MIKAFTVEQSGTEAESGAEELYFNLVDLETKKFIEVDGAVDHGIDPNCLKAREWLHKQLDAFIDQFKTR